MTAEQPVAVQQEAAAPAASGGALALHVALASLVGFAVTAIWALAGSDYFWPFWVWLGAAITVVLHTIGWRVARLPRGPRQALEGHALVSTTIVLLLVLLWALTEGPVFWPVWPLLGLGVLLAVHAILVALGWLGPGPREEELVERVDELTRTRRGALDVQATELRRIERDLHDGAQARLVALTMKLGRAEEKLADRPEVAELVRAARADAGSAIAELRDLARGIAPPVLADRGLVAAVESLGQRSAIPVAVDAVVDRRPAAGRRDGGLLRRRRGAHERREARRRRARARVGARERRHARARDRRHGQRRRRPGRRRADRSAPPRRGARRPAGGGEPAGRRHGRARGAAVRVVIAEDLALLREGIVALLRENDVEVVAQAEDAEGLLRVVGGHKPDLAIVDVRLPPGFSDEGLRAAIEARRRQPGLGVLILSQYVEPVYTSELLASGEGGVGYMLKERVGDVRAFLDAVRRVAAGGTALDREVVTELVRERDAERRRAREPDAARARGARADGGGPHERGDRARDGRPGRRRREAHLEHLRQARPAGDGRRPSAGAGGAGVPAQRLVRGGDAGERQLRH